MGLRVSQDVAEAALEPTTSVNLRLSAIAAEAIVGSADGALRVSQDVAEAITWPTGSVNLRLSAVAAEAVIRVLPAGVGAIVLDVYQINPPGTSLTYLATLDDAFDKQIRIERNGTGSGQFTISRHSANATAAILAPGNLVKVRIPTIDAEPIFAFFLGKTVATLVSEGEQGGEDITIGGDGAVSYWDWARWLTESYSVQWWDDAWGVPPAGTIGRVSIAAGTYWRYTVSSRRIVSRTQFTTGGMSAWFDHGQRFWWAAGTEFYGHISTLAQLSSGVGDNWWIHPTDAGITRTWASYAVAQRAEFGNIGDGTKPGQILERIYQEGVSADRPSHPIPLMTIDFTDTLDSAGAAWSSTDALLGITADLGDSYLATLAKLVETGIIDVEMGPDLDFHAWNAPHGRDLTANGYATGKVRFVKAVEGVTVGNIASELRRERTDGPVATFTQVVGNDASAQAELADAASRVTRETSTQGDTDDAVALAALGLADLNARLVRSDAIGFAIATGNDEAVGLYLPGPPGSANGKFWPGDLVTLHTGTGEQDWNNASERVAAITLSEDDAANLDVVVELGSGLGANETLATSPGAGSAGGSDGTAEIALLEATAEIARLEALITALQFSAGRGYWPMLALYSKF